MNWLRCDVKVWERGIPKLPKPAGNAAVAGFGKMRGNEKWYVLVGSCSYSWRRS